MQVKTAVLGEKCTIVLIVVSLAVLSVEYGHITGSALGVSIGPVSISNISTSKIWRLSLTIAALLALILCHLRTHWVRITDQFSAGYRESPFIIELVRSKVADAAEDPKYGSPVGGLRGSLRRKSQNLGKFIARLGNLSEPVIIYPSETQHLGAVRYGVCRVLGRGIWLSIHCPTILGVWALSVVAV